MAVSKRIPVAKTTISKNVAAVQNLIADVVNPSDRSGSDVFVNSPEKIFVKNLNLKKLSLEDLVTTFITLDNQTSLIKGLILIEARRRFKSNEAFGGWVRNNELLHNYSQQHLNQVVHLASFFENRDMQGISVTAGYEIAAPRNADVAKTVYAKVARKGYSVKLVREIIEKEKLKLSGVKEDVYRSEEEMASLFAEGGDGLAFLPPIEGDFIDLTSQGEEKPEDVVLERILKVVKEFSPSLHDEVKILERAVEVLRKEAMESLQNLAVKPT